MRWHLNCDVCGMYADCSGGPESEQVIAKIATSHAGTTGHVVSVWRRGRRRQAVKVTHGIGGSDVHD